MPRYCDLTRALIIGGHAFAFLLREDHVETPASFSSFRILNGAREDKS